MFLIVKQKYFPDSVCYVNLVQRRLRILHIFMNCDIQMSLSIIINMHTQQKFCFFKKKYFHTYATIPRPGKLLKFKNTKVELVEDVECYLHSWHQLTKN